MTESISGVQAHAYEGDDLDLNDVEDRLTNYSGYRPKALRTAVRLYSEPDPDELEILLDVCREAGAIEADLNELRTAARTGKVEGFDDEKVVRLKPKQAKPKREGPAEGVR